MADDVATLTTLYERFNARNIDGVFAALDDRVCWANGVDGGHVHGKTDLRAYWTRQWSQINPRVDPVSFTIEDDKVVVRVRQSLYDLSGKPIELHGGLSSQVVQHIFTFEGGKVVRFDIGKDG